MSAQDSLLNSEPAGESEYRVLARRWRPRNFAEMAGQEAVVQALVNGLNSGRVHHAFLFTGTRGVGKTTLARILAKCLNCEQQVSAEPCGECGACLDIDEGRFVDLIEVDAASKTKVDDTRELLDNVQYAATRGRYKVYLIDEVHMLSASSFNALLKTLEEPPEHVKFILATTDPQKIPVTILSRCIRFNLRRMSSEQISDYLSQRLTAEQIEFEPDALQAIAKAGDGSMRDSLSLLDQALAHGSGKLQQQAVQTMLGMVDSRFIEQLLQALQSNDAAALLAAAGEIYAQGQSADRSLQQLAEALHRIALLQQVPGYAESSDQQCDSLKAFAESISGEDIQLYYQIATLGRSELPHAPDPRIGLDMTLLRMLAFRPAEEPLAAPAGPAPVKAPATTATGSKPAGQSAAQTKAGRTTPPAEVEQKPAEATATVAASHPGETVMQAQQQEVIALDPEQWPELCRHLGFSGPLRVLTQHLIPVQTTERNLLLFNMEQRDAHLHTERLHEQLTRALAEHLQTPINIKLQFCDEILQSPARRQAEKNDNAFRKAQQVVASDAVINDLIDTFDARIVPGSVKPNNHSAQAAAGSPGTVEDL